jgi:hypothetical protein
MLDRPASKSPSKHRTFPTGGAKRAGPTNDRDRRRLSRTRRRQGLKLLRQVPVDEHAIIETLQNANRLSLEGGLHWDQVERAVGQLLADWIERWRKGVTRDLPP